MIRHIRGTVTDITDGQVVVDVAGVGYLLFVNAAGSHFTLETEVKLFTYMAVRETALDLYGFQTRDELELFTILLTLPKIGPKSALQILRQADLELLKSAVLSQDASHLSKMSGIGKKTAEKIVLGLKDKFEDFVGAYNTTGSVDGTSAQAPYTADAIDALIALGYPQADARKAIQQLPSDITTATQAVHAALKDLGKA